MLRYLLAALALPLALGACTINSNDPAPRHADPAPRYPDPPPPRYTPPPPVYESPAPRARVPRAAPTMQPAAAARPWERLGVTTVNGRNDHDVVKVGRSEGGFKSLQLRVNRSALQMHDVVVHFSDGTTFSPETREVFRGGATSTVIDLPGVRRRIDSVNFRYTDRSGGGPAQVEVWGR